MEITKSFLRSLQKAILARDTATLDAMLAQYDAADFALLAEYLTVEDFLQLFWRTEPQFQADTLAHLSSDVRGAFLDELSVEQIAALMDLTDSDDAVAIMRGLDLQRREEVLAHMAARQKARHIIALLPFDTSCAGGIMAKEFLWVSLDWTIEKSIVEIRHQAEQVEKIHTIYVVGESDKLVGRISFKKIFFADPSTKIADIYNPKFQFVYTYTPVEEVIAIMSQYSLEVLPVVNAKGKLLGVITLDDTLSIVQDKAEEMVQAMSGIAAGTAEGDTIWQITRARLPWLIVGILGGMVGAWFLGLFEGDLRVFPALAFFIPLITATGGNIGIQSSTLVVQALAGETIAKESLWGRLSRGFLVSLLNGLIIGLLAFLLSWVLFSDSKVASVVAVSIFCVCMLSSFLGTATPLLLSRLGINPALASGPFITTANDLLGLAIYFLIARGLM